MDSNLEQVLQDCLPFWNKLQQEDKLLLLQRAMFRKYEAGTVLHAERQDCVGLFLIKSGRIRAYIETEEGKEITLFRLLEHQLCIFSASCVFKNVDFDIWLSTETPLEAVVIPAGIYGQITKKNVEASNFTNDIICTRMSNIMWLLEQILFKSFDKRLANFLVEQSNIEKHDTIQITHEQIANHLGSAREVVTRMLKYFSEEQLISMKRGTIKILDKPKLLEMNDNK